MTMTITRPQLVAAMHRWETDYRNGDTISYEEMAQQTVEQVAEASADALIAYLVKVSVDVGGVRNG